MRRRISNTCLIALRHGKKIFVGADRRVSWDWGQAQKMPHPKVIKRDGMILAGTGDCYLCDLVVKTMIIPERPPKLNIDIYLNEMFIPAVQKLLIRKGFSDEHKILKIPSDMGAEILIALDNRLFSLTIDNLDPDNHYANGFIQLGEVNLPYGTGCGGVYAWAVVDELTNLEKEGLLTITAKEKIVRGLLMAGKYSPGCDSSQDIESI